MPPTSSCSPAITRAVRTPCGKLWDAGVRSSSARSVKWSAWCRHLQDCCSTTRTTRPVSRDVCATRSAANGAANKSGSMRPHTPGSALRARYSQNGLAQSAPTIIVLARPRPLKLPRSEEDMKRRLVDVLQCPACGASLDLHTIREAGEEVPHAVASPRCSRQCALLGISVPGGLRTGKVFDCTTCYSRDVTDGFLACSSCRILYPIIEGVPRLLRHSYVDYEAFFR